MLKLVTEFNFYDFQKQKISLLASCWEMSTNYKAQSSSDFRADREALNPSLKVNIKHLKAIIQSLNNGI